ncbi:hypothetical protein M427DRAFT_136989 [Gonapodya prolifera JEL478]|uniref:Uncharacterized protein n=1 Tax=Gonapodya prolifera (strain JEL478) TaxID=1344416 RepID=A0A139A7W7_GONPJ|nr:hypothetical protein M427DRAFT_136989 [Gonapodya prolifera JEL478]|eukprot:KXS12857.1 hypothetical protein M427DRAFT_136989 [Gonapodya prolifera JEL478]
MFLVLQQRGFNWTHPSVGAVEEEALRMTSRLFAVIPTNCTITLEDIEYRDHNSPNKDSLGEQGCSWSRKSVVVVRKALANRVQELGVEMGAIVILGRLEYVGQSGDSWYEHRTFYNAGPFREP